MEGYGFTMNEGMITMLNFMLGMQLIIISVTWQLPDWLGHNLSKAGLTDVVISIIPALQGLYLMSTWDISKQLFELYLRHCFIFTANKTPIV